MKMTTKQKLYVLIAVLATILNFVTPIFSLMRGSVKILGSTTSNYASGYSILGDGYPKGIRDVAEWLFASTIIHLVLAALAFILVIVFSTGKARTKHIESVALAQILLTVVLNFVYLINGAVTKNAMIESLQGYGMVETFAYIPFIIALLIAIAHICVRVFVVTPVEIESDSEVQKIGTVEEKEDEVSIPLCILSAVFPLFGFIYWAVKYGDLPKRAKACGITSLIMFAVSFIVNIINMIINMQ